MEDPIIDRESLATEPHSITPRLRRRPSAVIVHHNGTAEVSGFTTIKEIDPTEQTVRVTYPNGDYEDYHVATITEVRNA